MPIGAIVRGLIMIDWTDPAWYALAMSIMSGLVALTAIFYSRRASRASIDQALIKQRNDINNAIVQNKVRGPLRDYP